MNLKYILLTESSKIHKVKLHDSNQQQAGKGKTIGTETNQWFPGIGVVLSTKGPKGIWWEWQWSRSVSWWWWWLYNCGFTRFHWIVHQKVNFTLYWKCILISFAIVKSWVSCVLGYPKKDHLPSCYLKEPPSSEGQYAIPESRQRGLHGKPTNQTSCLPHRVRAFDTKIKSVPHVWLVKSLSRMVQKLEKRWICKQVMR